MQVTNSRGLKVECVQLGNLKNALPLFPQDMSRRSFRLMSSGYYNSDEESDSSSVTNISYRENPVKYVVPL